MALMSKASGSVGQVTCSIRSYAPRCDAPRADGKKEGAGLVVLSDRNREHLIIA